jgi:hypothetical protein
MDVDLIATPRLGKPRIGPSAGPCATNSLKRLHPKTLKRINSISTIRRDWLGDVRHNIPAGLVVARALIPDVCRGHGL